MDAVIHRNPKVDCLIENISPDSDSISVTVGDIMVSVEREAGNQITVYVTDSNDGSEHKMILGQEGIIKIY